MKYYIIAGEASGDLHGSNLIKAIHRQDHSANIRCWGGDLMQQAGAELVVHYRRLAFMGFAEVIRNLPEIFRNIAFCKRDILAFQPDVLILIDYPGFNLRISSWAKKQQLRVAFYISPQVWAWKESRVRQMKKDIDRMIVILPFEKEYYQRRWNWDVSYVGHPLVDAIDDWKKDHLLSAPPAERKNIALLPGSRKQEIAMKLPLMLEATRSFPGYHFTIAKAPGQDDEFYASFLEPYPDVSLVAGQTYQLLNESVAALVTSGTATLETALFRVPEVVCYKGSTISYWLARWLIKIKYISLVNLIMDREVVKELIQHELTVPNLVRELTDLLHNEERRKQLFSDYDALWEKLGSGDRASDKAAAIICELAK